MMDRALLEEPHNGSKDRAAIMGAQLSSLLRTYVRGALLAELESRLSARIAAGQALTGNDVSRIYGELLRDYFDGTSIELNDDLADEWMTFPTLFSGPHYAVFSIAMATALRLEDEALSGNARAIAAVRDGIGRSETHFSNDILRELGIEIGSRKTYDSVSARIERLARRVLVELDQVESTS